MRICFYGGPCSAKSTLAPEVFSSLKRDNYSVEYVSEYIKSWAYLGRIPKSYDQFYIFGKQLHAEDIFLSNKVNHIVTDSPLLLQVMYSKKYGVLKSWESLLNIALDFDQSFPSLNILLDRTGLKYNPHGRYENEEQAIAVDIYLKDFLDKNKVNYVVLKSVEHQQVIDYIKGNIS